MAPAYFIYLLKAYCFQPIPTPTENGHAGTKGLANTMGFLIHTFPFFDIPLQIDKLFPMLAGSLW
jgi:hypothetical protein